MPRPMRRSAFWSVAQVLLLAVPATPQTPGRVTVDVGVRNPAVSPDGSTLAVSILGKIWTLPVTGGEAVQVTRGQGWDRYPAWSPDGRFLAYSHWTSAGTVLSVRTVATGNVRSLLQVPGEIRQIAFDPAGQHVYYVDHRSQYDAHLWRVPVEGGAPRQLTHTRNWHEWSFALSPDGDEVLVESGRFQGTEVYVLGLDSVTATRITDTRARESSVAWSPDGRHRAWVERFNGVDRVVVADASGEGWDAPRELHSFPYGQTELAFGPDGSLFASSARMLYRMDLEGGAAAPIPFTATFETAADPADDLVITDVRLVDVTSGEVTPDAWVVVRDGRIASVGTGMADAPEGTPVIDGGGRTLLPGLMDNHYHFWSPGAGPDLLARGVTSIRDPGVAIADGMDYKDAIRLGLLAGPDISSAGPLLDGPDGYHPMVDVSLEDPAAAAPLVRALKEQGVDALKAYFLLEPEVLAAVMEEARAQGLPVTGHIGVRTGWGEAMDAGIDGFSHVRVWRDFLSPEAQPDGKDESLDSSRDPVARMQADWTDIDPDSPEVEALIRRMAETGTAMDPTIFIQRISESARSRFSLDQFEAARESFERMKTFVRKAVEAGVPLLAGTDNVRLNDELETYAEAGVPNDEILRAATVNGARWLGREDDFGTVAPGTRANLILVDGDPLEDVSVLRDVALVVKGGVVVFRKGG